MALGCFGVALVLPDHGDRRAWHAGAGKASWLWLFAYFVVITIGELYLSPIGLSLVTKVAPGASSVDDDGRVAGDELYRQFPRRLSRQLLVAGWQKPEFFLMIAAIAALAGAAIYVTRRPLKGALRE